MQYISSNFLTNRKQIKAEDFKPQHSRKLFSEVPKDVFQEISDFLGNEETLNKLFRLSKEIFSTILDENITLNVISMNGTIDKINYYEILKTKAECFDQCIQLYKRFLGFSKSYYEHEFLLFLSNLKKSIWYNLLTDPLYRDITFGYIVYFTFSKFLFSTHTHQIFICNFTLLYFVLCIFVFIANEYENPHLVISEEQKNSILQCVHAKKKLPALQKHLDDINEILKRIEEEKSDSPSLYFQ